MKVVVVFAESPSVIWQREVESEGSLTIAQALELSGFYEAYPEFLNKQPSVGVFAKKQSLDTELLDGDRLEVYRELNFDPMESRRRRAAHRQAGILKRKHLKPDRAKRVAYMEHKDK